MLVLKGFWFCFVQLAWKQERVFEVWRVSCWSCLFLPFFCLNALGLTGGLGRFLGLQGLEQFLLKDFVKSS